MAAAGLYVVEQGDGLYGIARKLGVTPISLLVANRLPNDHVLWPGEVVKYVIPQPQPEPERYFV